MILNLSANPFFIWKTKYSDEESHVLIYSKKNHICFTTIPSIYVIESIKDEISVACQSHSPWISRIIDQLLIVETQKKRKNEHACL
jgi:hypothetical protein